MNRKAFLKAFVLALALSLTANYAVRAKDDKPPVASFAGLIKDKAVDKLVKPSDKEVKQVYESRFVLSIFSDAKAFQTFTDAAGLKKLPFDVDWDKQAVIVVVLKENTNGLRFKRWGLKDDTGELVFYWELIEPFWANQFPALMYRFDKQGLKKVVVKYELPGFKGHQFPEQALGEIPCP